MINRDSNNSIIRTNIFSKSVGGRKKKNKTLKKRKGGFSFFSDKPCQMEEENLNNKRKNLKKEARKALLNYREEFNKLLIKLKEDTKAKCKEYTTAQKEIEKEQQMRKNKAKGSIFDTKLKFKGGLTKSIKNKFKKELINQEQMFNSHLYNIVNQIYHKGGDADYCASIIREYQEKVKELKKKFEILLHEYIEKQYHAPLQQARSLYNQCALEHNEGDVEIPISSRPNIPTHKTTDTIDSDTNKLFSSMVAGPEYENGKVKKPVIIAADKPADTTTDSFEAELKAAKALVERQKLIEESTKGLQKQQQQQQQQQNTDFKSAKIGNTTYSKQELEHKTKPERDIIKQQFEKDLAAANAPGKNKGNRTDSEKILVNNQKEIRSILEKP